MSELMSEKGVCRIVVESTDKDDYWLDAESDIELYEILSVEDTDGEDNDHEDCGDHRRGLKRKIHHEEGWRHDQRTHGQILYRTERLINGQGLPSNFRKPENQIILQKAAKRFKPPPDSIGSLESEHQKTEANAPQSPAPTGRPTAIVRANAQFDSTMSSIENDNSIKEISAGASRSYLQMTDAVKRLTEGLARKQDNIKEAANVSLHNQTNARCNKSDNSSQTLYAMIKNPLVSNEYRMPAGQLQAPPIKNDTSKSIVNELRAYRLHTNESRTVDRSTSQFNRPHLSPKTIHSFTITSFEQPQYECNRNCNENNKIVTNLGPHTNTQQMSDDAINVKLAAEALSLLKYRGRSSFEMNEEPAPAAPYTPAQVPTVPFCCTAAHYYQENCDTGIDMSPKRKAQLPVTNRIEIRPIDKEQGPPKHRVLFDSTLEITDAATGARIPLESLYLNSNENCLHQDTESKSIIVQRPEDNQKNILTDTLLQLSDTVTCVKIPLEQPDLPRDKENIKQGNEFKLPTSQRPESDEPARQEEIIRMPDAATNVSHSFNNRNNDANTKNTTESRVQSHELTAPSNDVALSERLETRFAALGEAEFQLTSDMLQKILGITTQVKIPLDAIKLPKNAATGVKVFFKASQNKESSHSRSSSSSERKHHKSHDLHSKKVDGGTTQENQHKDNLSPDEKLPQHVIAKSVKIPTPTFNIREQVRGMAGTTFKQSTEDTKNIKLPLEPWLRINRDANSQQMNENGKPHSPHSSHGGTHHHHSSLHKPHSSKYHSATINGNGSGQEKYHHRTSSHNIKYSTHPQPISFGSNKPYPQHLSSSHKLYSSKPHPNTPSESIPEQGEHLPTDETCGYPSKINTFNPPLPSPYEQEPPPPLPPLSPHTSSRSPPAFVLSNGTVIRETTKALQQNTEECISLQQSHVYPQTKSVITPLNRSTDREEQSNLQIPVLFPSQDVPRSVITALDTLSDDSREDRTIPHLKQVGPIWTTKHTHSDIVPPASFLTKSVITALNTPTLVINDNRDEGIGLQHNTPFYVICQTPNTSQSVITPLESTNVIKDEFIRDEKTVSQFQQIGENWTESVPSVASPALSAAQIGPLSPIPAMQPAPTLSPNAPQSVITSLESPHLLKEIKIEPTTSLETESPDLDVDSEPVQPSARIPDRDPSTVKTPLEAFSLLINDDMIHRIMRYTNAKIERQAAKAKNRNSFRKPTNENELKAFLGLLLISGALRQNTTTVPEIWSECFGAGIYRATLPEPRFQVLSQSICFGDSTSRDKCIIKDEFTRIGALWEDYLNNCKRFSLPLLHIAEVIENGGDDDSGQLYSTARKTVNMPLRILFSMLDGAGVRGLAMFRRANPNVKMCQREFLKQVGMGLVRPHLRSRMMQPTLKKPIKELIESILNRRNENEPQRSSSPPADNCLKKHKRCQLCAWNRDRKTKYQCESCQRAMCKKHRTNLCIDCVQDLM